VGSHFLKHQICQKADSKGGRYSGVRCGLCVGWGVKQRSLVEARIVWVGRESGWVGWRSKGSGWEKWGLVGEQAELVKG
jgi:hypothetical protein